MSKILYHLSLVVGPLLFSQIAFSSPKEKPWPRSEDGKLVVKEFQLEAHLEKIVKIPTAVPNNLLITFQLKGKEAPADIFRIKYSRYRGKDKMLEPFMKSAPGSRWMLTIDAIAVNPPTDNRFGGIREYRHDDLTLLFGTLKDVKNLTNGNEIK